MESRIDEGRLSLEKEMATHSSVLAWRIPWTRSLVGYSPWSRKESDMTERLHFHFISDVFIILKSFVKNSFSSTEYSKFGDHIK